MTAISGVLFDLDGTLLDTVHDLVFALNEVRKNNHLPALPIESIRPIVSLGAKAMAKLAFEIDETHVDFNRLRDEFLAVYQLHLADSARFFPRTEQVLAYLDQEQIPWGIVTNRLTHHTMALLKTLGIDKRATCIICGDSLPTIKPDPEPILHACEILQRHPKDCLYVGDAATDVIASKAAGARSVVALYGYISAHEDPYRWQADGYINEPIEIIEWLKKINEDDA